MTRSSTNKLYTPYKDPEREFRSSRIHIKNLSLEKLRSPDFNLLSDEEYSEEEEEEEEMAKTMEQYMSKTRIDYGLGVSRPKIDNKYQFELKGNEPTGSIKTWEDLKTKFLNKYCPPGRTAKKMEEINNFQQEPDETLYQAWERFKELLMKCPQHYLIEMQEMPKQPSKKWLNTLKNDTMEHQEEEANTIQSQLNNLGREIKKVNEKVYVAQVGCEQCKGPHYTKDCPQKEEGNALEEAYYTQFGGPFKSMEYTLSKFMSESAKRHEENSNLIKEIRASTDAAIRNQGASIKILEIQIGKMSKIKPIRRIHWTEQYIVIQVETNDGSFSKSLDNHYYEEEGNYGPKFMEAYGASHINNTIPRKEKDLGSFTLPCC
ncbi:pyruvate dehydrogenase (acetyl-transferring) kinase, mitochondrial [Tanacetum coccineum]